MVEAFQNDARALLAQIAELAKGVAVQQVRDQAATIEDLLAPPAPMAEPGLFLYRNWRGEVAGCQIEPLRVWYGATEHHPDPQWFVRGLDVDKGETRDFALADFGAPGTKESDDDIFAALAADLKVVLYGEGDVEADHPYDKMARKLCNGYAPEALYIERSDAGHNYPDVAFMWVLDAECDPFQIAFDGDGHAEIATDGMRYAMFDAHQLILIAEAIVYGDQLVSLSGGEDDDDDDDAPAEKEIVS